jgi:hypothetical protein
MSISPFSTGMMPAAQQMMPATPQMLPTNYSQTGVPGIGGGYAYTPGSGMAGFMDNLNNTVAVALSGPNGGSIVDWANGLLLQQQQRKQLQLAQQQMLTAGMMGGMGTMGAMGTPGAGTGMSGLTQMFQMLMSMLSSMQGASA